MPKSDEYGEGIGLHNGELHSLNRSPNIVKVIKSRRLKRAGQVARIEESRNSSKMFTGKSTGKGSLEKSRHRWEDNVRMDLKEMRVDVMS